MNASKLYSYWIMALLVIIGYPTVAFSQLSLEGEFRPRTEYRDGYRILRTENTKPAFFTSQRTRVSLHYKTDQYKIRFSGQDVRVWGDVDQLQDNSNLNIHEVWAEVDLSTSLGVRMGRQELIYNNHRLLGSVNWTQQARSHDALVLKYRNKQTELKVDIGGAYNQDSENLLGNSYSLNNYKVLSYIWAKKQFGNLNISAIGLTDGFENASGSTNYRYTYGTYVDYSKDAIQLNAGLYLQRGDDATRENISAGMYSLSGSYNFDPFQLKVGYDHLSGGDAGDRNPTRYTFSTLYATNHKFYGNMDYFLNIVTDTRGGGLQDLYVQTNYTLNKSAKINVAYHYFALSGSISDPVSPGQKLDKRLGSEIDVNIAKRFTPEIAFKVGYSMLMPSKSLEKIQSVNAKNTQHWGWVMLSISPDFLN